MSDETRMLEIKVAALTAQYESANKAVEMLTMDVGERLSESQKIIHSLREELRAALMLLREGKAKFAPNTTNSFVDDFLDKHKGLI